MSDAAAIRSFSSAHLKRVSKKGKLCLPRESQAADSNAIDLASTCFSQMLPSMLLLSLMMMMMMQTWMTTLFLMADQDASIEPIDMIFFCEKCLVEETHTVQLKLHDK